MSAKKEKMLKIKEENEKLKISIKEDQELIDLEEKNKELKQKRFNQSSLGKLIKYIKDRLE